MYFQALSKCVLVQQFLIYLLFFVKYLNLLRIKIYNTPAFEFHNVLSDTG